MLRTSFANIRNQFAIVQDLHVSAAHSPRYIGKIFQAWNAVSVKQSIYETIYFNSMDHDMAFRVGGALFIIFNLADDLFAAMKKAEQCQSWLASICLQLQQCYLAFFQTLLHLGEIVDLFRVEATRKWATKMNDI